ncbi:MAG: fibrobacter succinogenes major paralogous domain-containing protein [Fibromonadales bacterium]|nr:fibrobacter succinogenes major paralogous domain-containing protein [Fibromonadales bacterium]
MKGVKLFLPASFLLAMVLIFSCGEYAEVPYEQRLFETVTDSRDGKRYKALKIGNQTWMAENMNYAAEGSRCYKDLESNCNTYGRLYSWDASKEACPAGWHLPTNYEWTVLINYAGGRNKAGLNLKANSDLWKVNNSTDESGFSALPSGFYFPATEAQIAAGNDGFWSMGITAKLWSTAQTYTIEGEKEDISWTANNNADILSSVRCVRHDNLIWDLYTHRNLVITGGSWYKDIGENASPADFSCSATSCPWIDNNNGRITINYSQYNGGSWMAFGGVAFFWRPDSLVAPEVWGTHTGLCVEYALEGEGNFFVQIEAGDKYEYDHYRILMPKKSEVGKEFFKFNDFEQEGWGPATTLEEAKQHSRGIQFQGKLVTSTPVTGAKATLTLKSIRWDSCD